jgi:hypothetical protein
MNRKANTFIDMGKDYGVSDGKSSRILLLANGE